MTQSYKYIFVAALFGVAAVFVFGSYSDAADRRTERAQREVRAVLDAQVAAWNRGDIEGFMAGYEQSAETTFISGETVTRGWQTVLERYRKGYATREKMGTLTFSELELKPLSPFYMLTHGRWHLARTADAPQGRFTLLLRRTASGWRIVHDHTSSASS